MFLYPDTTQYPLNQHQDSVADVYDQPDEHQRNPHFNHWKVRCRQPERPSMLKELSKAGRYFWKTIRLMVSLPNTTLTSRTWKTRILMHR